MDSTTILSAAHCFYDTSFSLCGQNTGKQFATDNNFTIRAGVIDKDDPGGQDIKVDTFIWPPVEYNPRTVQNDIIIIKLKSPLVLNSLNEKVHPAALPPSLIFGENVSIENCIVSGWGKLNSSKFLGKKHYNIRIILHTCWSGQTIAYSRTTPSTQPYMLLHAYLCACMAACM